MRQSSDPKVTGIKNGGSQAKIDRNGFANKEYYDQFLNYFKSNDSDVFWRNLGVIPDFDFELQCVRLEKKAKVTDILSYDPNLSHGGQFLMSERLISLLGNFNLPTHKIYKSQIYRPDGDVLDYNLLYCPPIDYGFIDFEKTQFFTGNSLRGKKIFSIESGVGYQQMKRGQIFQTEKVVLNGSFDKSIDLFTLKVSLANVFISERLKNALVEYKISGINIVEASDPSIELTT